MQSLRGGLKKEGKKGRRREKGERSGALSLWTSGTILRFINSGGKETARENASGLGWAAGKKMLFRVTSRRTTLEDGAQVESFSAWRATPVNMQSRGSFN